MLRRLHFLLFPKVSLRFFRKHVLIIASIFISDNFHISKSTFQHIQTVLNLIHFFHGVNHGTQVLIREGLQGIVQNIIHLCGLEFLGKLRGTNLHEQPDKLLILLRFPESENILIDMFFILALAVCEKICLAQFRLHLPFVKGNSGGAHFLIQPEVIADPLPVQNNKAPEIHGFPALCPLPDSYGTVFSGLLFFEFQEKISGCLILSFFAQKIIFHPSVAGAKGIQTAWGTVTIQHKRNKTLRGDGFSGTILPAKEKLPILKFKIFFVI